MILLPAFDNQDQQFEKKTLFHRWAYSIKLQNSSSLNIWCKFWHWRKCIVLQKYFDRPCVIPFSTIHHSANRCSWLKLHSSHALKSLKMCVHWFLKQNSKFVFHSCENSCAFKLIKKNFKTVSSFEIESRKLNYCNLFIFCTVQIWLR